MATRLLQLHRAGTLARLRLRELLLEHTNIDAVRGVDHVRGASTAQPSGHAANSAIAQHRSRTSR
jgi:hypothetical protein